ncbi:MAG: conserved hypothetical rane protein [Alphaproteobacteria bacterium]|nr:conserved hypothetical rane protein [Alphaproteobacteria bacterium]
MSSRSTAKLRAPIAMARVAGALWLVSMALGIYAEVFVRGSMIVHGDAAATATKIVGGQAALRTGFVADLVADMAYLGATLLLYGLLRRVNRTLTVVMLGFGLVGSAVMAINLVNLFAPIPSVRRGGCRQRPVVWIAPAFPKARSAIANVVIVRRRRMRARRRRRASDRLRGLLQRPDGLRLQLVDPSKVRRPGVDAVGVSRRLQSRWRSTACARAWSPCCFITWLATTQSSHSDSIARPT